MGIAKPVGKRKIFVPRRELLQSGYALLAHPPARLTPVTFQQWDFDVSDLAELEVTGILSAITIIRGGGGQRVPLLLGFLFGDFF
jgi:hypothetical protein